MRFSDILTFMDEQAIKLGLPIYFGDNSTINVMVNDISGMFLTFDVPDGGMAKLPPATRKYNVVLQCLDESFYGEDNLAELDTLVRTDLALNKLMSTFVCHFDVDGLIFRKVQNIYDSKKSGWQVTFSVTDDLLNYG
nr:MAG TPA: hypothetical protein [Caudoviricetes sp.]